MFSWSTTRRAAQIVFKMHLMIWENAPAFDPATWMKHDPLKGWSDGGWSAERSTLNGLVCWIGRHQGNDEIDDGDRIDGLHLLFVGKVPYFKDCMILEKSQNQ